MHRILPVILYLHMHSTCTGYYKYTHRILPVHAQDTTSTPGNAQDTTSNAQDTTSTCTGYYQYMHRILPEHAQDTTSNAQDTTSTCTGYSTIVLPAHTGYSITSTHSLLTSNPGHQDQVCFRGIEVDIYFEHN